MRQGPWQKVRFAILTWLDSWPPLQRSESWRENTLLAEVEERPRPVPLGQRHPPAPQGPHPCTPHGSRPALGGWRNWITKWISEPQP
jgi:hypothetical protein